MHATQKLGRVANPACVQSLLLIIMQTGSIADVQCLQARSRVRAALGDCCVGAPKVVMTPDPLHPKRCPDLSPAQCQVVLQGALRRSFQRCDRKNVPDKVILYAVLFCWLGCPYMILLSVRCSNDVTMEHRRMCMETWVYRRSVVISSASHLSTRGLDSLRRDLLSASSDAHSYR